MERRALQIVTVILGLVPVATGLIGMSGIGDPIYASMGLPANPLLDSNLRFFAGVWLGLGLAIFWLVPKIEQHTLLFRVIWGMIFIGGIGRIVSMLFVGLPPAPFIGFTILEIVGAPVFVIWQRRIARMN
ncbi:MAG: DUF4345 domain-containing protein [Xanthobacteraceae bacterium]